MRVGLFADTHDHLDNIRLAVSLFNARQCELVIFAGDLVSTFAVPPLRALNCPLVACFGDNEGNKAGIRGGLEIIGSIGDPPFGFTAADGTRFLVTHQWELLRGDYAGCDVVVFAHTHKPLVQPDSHGHLLINPGETSGWTYSRPTVAILDTTTRSAEIVELR
jgi:putative phosphoesterase